jgi:hypothetical protein
MQEDKEANIKVELCKKYLEDRLGEIDSIDKNNYGESSGDWQAFVIKNQHLYHKMAQRLGIKELTRNGNLHYEIRLPMEYCTIEPPLDTDDWNKWNIILVSEVRGEFENAYGSSYNIINPYSNNVKK